MATPRLSIVTTCKGRLHHLKESLPRFLAQPDAEVIVVDYDCPDGTGLFVEKEFPRARVVKVADRPHFNTSRARNLGAAQATADWLAFLDADIVIKPDFLTGNASNMAEANAFFHFRMTSPETGSSFGSCLVRRADFQAVGGYDELMDGYGGEDQDFYFRLVLLGRFRKPLDHALIDRIIMHGDAERVRFFPHGSYARSNRVNAAYLVVKDSLLRQLGHDGLDEAKRRQVFSLVRDVIEQANRNPDAPVRFEVELPPDPHFTPGGAWRHRRHLSFEFTSALHPDADHLPRGDPGDADR